MMFLCCFFECWMLWGMSGNVLSQVLILVLFLVISVMSEGMLVVFVIVRCSSVLRCWYFLGFVGSVVLCCVYRLVWVVVLSVWFVVVFVELFLSMWCRLSMLFSFFVVMVLDIDGCGSGLVMNVLLYCFCCGSRQLVLVSLWIVLCIVFLLILNDVVSLCFGGSDFFGVIMLSWIVCMRWVIVFLRVLLCCSG